MELVELPMISINESPVRAASLMRENQRGGVIAQENAYYWLFTAGDICYGIARQYETISYIRRRKPVHQLSEEEMSKTNLDVSTPTQTETEYHDFLDRVGKDYVIISWVPGKVKVVTRHETLGHLLNAAPKSCYCENDPSHDEFHPPASTGDKCPICTKKINCM